MVERVQVDALTPEATTRWDQRGMAALAVVYVVVQYLMTTGHHDGAATGTTAVVYGVVLATPLLARRATTFAVACGIVAALVLLAGIVYWIYLPAALPLLLAMIRIPERWAPFATPVLLALMTELLATGAYLTT
jgi:hypothetical protein